MSIIPYRGLSPQYLETLGTGASKAGGDKKEEKKDIASLLAAEVADLKDRRKKRFRWHDTHIKGVVYIEWPGEGCNLVLFCCGVRYAVRQTVPLNLPVLVGRLVQQGPLQRMLAFVQSLPDRPRRHRHAII